MDPVSGGVGEIEGEAAPGFLLKVAGEGNASGANFFGESRGIGDAKVEVTHAGLGPGIFGESFIEYQMNTDAVAFEDGVVGRFAGFVAFVAVEGFEGESGAIPGDGGFDVIDGEDGVGVEDHGRLMEI
jgi:hypothetical protein